MALGATGAAVLEETGLLDWRLLTRKVAEEGSLS